MSAPDCHEAGRWSVKAVGIAEKAREKELFWCVFWRGFGKLASVFNKLLGSFGKKRFFPAGWEWARRVEWNSGLGEAGHGSDSIMKDAGVGR
jgi:hypothetical protein